MAHSITDMAYAEALEAGRRAAEREFRAQAATYVVEQDAIQVITVANGGFVIPRRLVGALQDVEPAALAGMELWPDGSVIEIDCLDIHVSVDGMIRAALPVLVPRRITVGDPRHRTRGWKLSARRPAPPSGEEDQQATA